MAKTQVITYTNFFKNFSEGGLNTSSLPSFLWYQTALFSANRCSCERGREQGQDRSHPLPASASPPLNRFSHLQLASDDIMQYCSLPSFIVPILRRRGEPPLRRRRRIESTAYSNRWSPPIPMLNNSVISCVTTAALVGMYRHFRLHTVTPQWNSVIGSLPGVSQKHFPV